MKKLYFLLAAMLLCLSASASKVYYDNSSTKWSSVYAYVWGGTTGEVKGWPGTEMTNDGNGIWSVEFSGTPGYIIFHPNISGTQTGNLDFVDGATYDFDGVKGAEKSDFTVYFDNSASNWSKVNIYYWDGGASNSWPGVEMTSMGSNKYSYTVTAVSAPGKVIFLDGSASSWSAGTTQTNDLTWETGATYNLNGKVSGDTPTPPVTSDVYFFGDIDGAGWTAAALTNNSYTFTATKDSYFSFTTDAAGSDWSKVWRPSTAPANQIITESGSFTANGSGDNGVYQVAAGTYTVTVTDATAKTFSITVSGGDTPTPGNYPATLYMLGNIEGSSPAWSPAYSGTSAAGENGVYKFNNVQFTPAGEGEKVAYFSFVTATGADWNTDVNTSDRYGAPAKDTPVVFETAMPVTKYAAGEGGNASAAESWMVTFIDDQYYTYKMNITVDLASMTMTVIKGSSGIEGVNVDSNAAAVYYNLQGVRVDNPTSGLYIRVAGNQVSKVLVK